MSYIEKEKLIKADIASIENRVRHAFNQGYDLGFKDGKKRAKPLELEPTTENCESCRYYGSHHEVCNYCYKCSLWTEKEPTTKNDLGVDCISREQALVAIRNLYPGMPRVDFNGSLRKWVDKYKPYIECDDAIKQLPSVTPQEPVKKLEEQIKQLQNRCHALTHGQICVFCPYECEHKAESENP